MKLFKQVMVCHPGKISCIYLINIDTVKDLIKTFKITNALNTEDLSNFLMIIKRKIN